MNFWNWLRNLFTKPTPAKPVLVPPVKPDAPSVVPSIPSVPQQEPSQSIGAPKPSDGLTRFDRAIRYVMVNEDGKSWDKDDGCYTNDPRDPGGRTIWGVIQTEYEKFIGRSLSESEMKAMPRTTAIEVYRKEFWSKIRGDEYDSESAAIAIMDTAVNKGLGGCLVCLRDATAINFDTTIPYGNNVITQVNMIEPDRFLTSFENAVEHYIDARIAKYPNMEWARRGWTNRAKRLLDMVKQ